MFNKHEVEQAFKLYVGPTVPAAQPDAGRRQRRRDAGVDPLHSRALSGVRQEVKRTVAQGDLVAVHSRYFKHAADRDSGQGQAVVDIYRLEHGKIVEHWDVVQDIPAKSADNDNSMF